MRNQKPTTDAVITTRISSLARLLLPPRRLVSLLVFALVFVAIGRPAPALARSGTHGPTVSTYDPRASSIAVTFRHFTHKTGSLDHVMYTSAFSSTSGRLISQFGVGFAYRSAKGQPTGYGASASAVRG